MTDLPGTMNPQVETLAGEAHDEGKSAVVEPHWLTRKVKTARGTLGSNLRLLKYGRHEVVLPS